MIEKFRSFDDSLAVVKRVPMTDPEIRRTQDRMVVAILACVVLILLLVIIANW